jgi:tetratricopeptide (TPR) repeat protein
VVELRNAVGIAQDVIAEGERGSNQEAFVEDVLKRLAETTKRGDFDGGAKAVDDALAELDRREEEHCAASRRSRETLLEAGVEQDLLRRDPAAVARRIEAIAAMETTGGNPAWSQRYRDRWSTFFAEGKDKGVNLSREVAIEMARRVVASARNAGQRGTALVWLGIALFRLGERESGTARLEKAVAAYREALQENTRDRVPLEWATTQMGLRLALFGLGEREGGTARLDEAVAAYREALRKLTRARRSSGPRAPATRVSPSCCTRNDAAMRRWRSWRCSRSRRLSRHCATAAMRLPPPIVKRDCQTPARLPKSSPSADEVDHSAGTTAIDTRLIVRDFHGHGRA